MSMDKEMQEEILAQQYMQQNQNAIQEVSAMRENLMRNPSPESNYETAVFLLQNSDIFFTIPEIEKEIKLGNFGTDEKLIIQNLLNSYQDLILVNDLQIQKYASKLNEKDFKKFKKEQNLSKLDKLNFLRRAVSMSSVSRGKDGFERKAQNTIISTQTINNEAMLNSKPASRVSGWFGGGKR